MKRRYSGMAWNIPKFRGLYASMGGLERRKRISHVFFQIEQVNSFAESTYENPAEFWHRTTKK